MKIDFQNYSINFKIIQQGEKGFPAVLLLHGFSNSSEEWSFLQNKLAEQFPVYALDFLGHGKSSSPENISYYEFDSIRRQLLAVINYLHCKKIILAGYSMGGRAALGFAVHHPDLVCGLIIESSTPGIIEENKRKERVQSDEKLAAKILKEGIEKFTAEWINKPLFNSLNNIGVEKKAELIKMKNSNGTRGLANSLIGFGAGIMPSFWSGLGSIDFPVLLITGSEDGKFTEIAERMFPNFSNCTREIINGAGHNAHLEKPNIFINLVNAFLNNNFKRDNKL